MGQGISLFLQNCNDFCRKHINRSFNFEIEKAVFTVLMAQSQTGKGALEGRQKVLHEQQIHSLLYENLKRRLESEQG